MKMRFVLPALIGAVLLTGAVFWWSNRAHAPLPAVTPVIEAPTRTQDDPKEVFQKAFWKRPGAEDKILHAGRREWDGKEGLKKWDWFLVVEPSPALLKHLREDNAFGLASAPAPPPDDSAPPWFRYDLAAVEALGSARSGMVLMFGKSRNILYATGQGGGFRPGAPESAPPVTLPDQSAGRLPPTAPPDLRNP
jgi:hypothetical protein